MDNLPIDDNGILHIGDALALPMSAIEFVFTRASGPGGQHVNRTDSAVQLRLQVSPSPWIPEDVLHRLQELAPSQLTAEGMLLIECQAFRSQLRNRETALKRLVTLLLAASRKPKVRRPTKPTKASRERRIKAKKQRSDIKANRQRHWE